MNIKKVEDCVRNPYTALLYCPAGVGKSTAIGLIAERSEGNTLVLDTDRTIGRTLAKDEVVHDTSKLFIEQVDNIHTFGSWTNTLMEISENDCAFLKDNNITTVAVDNVSELERCILSDLGSMGKNKGVPAQGDYQTMQFKLVNSLRYMKSWNVNILWTAWETTEQFVNPDGTQYSRLYPKINAKILDNICGLCDVVGKIMVKQDGTHGIILSAMQNVYAKNQIDARKGCLVEDFLNFGTKVEEKEGKNND